MMGSTLSCSVPSFHLSLKSVNMVCCTWDIVPETVDMHGCPKTLQNSNPKALWGNQEWALPNSLKLA